MKGGVMDWPTIDPENYTSFYILDEDHTPRKFGCDSGYPNWDAWLRDNLHLKFVAMSLRKGLFHESKISTVFLGLDHNYSKVGAPILFETMVFGGPLDQEQWRYETWDEAKAHHKEVVKAVEASYKTSNYLKWMVCHTYESARSFYSWNIKYPLGRKVNVLWKRLRS